MEQNVAGQSWAWLTSQLRQRVVADRGTVAELWAEMVTELAVPPRVISPNAWRPDYWVAMGVGPHELGIGVSTPIWALTESMSSWPTYGLSQRVEALGLPSRRSRREGVDSILAAATLRGPTTDPAQEFHNLVATSTGRRDPAECQANVVRSWLATVLGPALRGVVLTPAADELINPAFVVDRLSWVLEHAEEEARVRPEGEAELEVLYTAVLTESGLITAPARVGQTLDWRQYWSWLAHPLDADAALAAVQLTARLLRSQVVVDGLFAALERFDRVVLCVLRRWLLGLQALTWLECALQRPWTWVRPEDLMTFAFCALRPSWPRPSFAVSHRSGDAKAELQQHRMWRNPIAAIDACFVPAWELNLGMIWGLFAATPGLVRVHSPGYAISEWCNREAEMIDYLVTTSDFLDGRRVVDVDLNSLDRVDGLAAVDAGRTDHSVPPFPPPSLVLLAQPLPEAVVRVLRAAGLMRTLRAVAFLRDPEAVNAAADALLRGERPPFDPPTFNRGGWSAYSSILRDVAELCGHDPAQGSPLRLRAAADRDEVTGDVELLRAFPDFGYVGAEVADLFAAFEWYRTLFVWYVERVGHDQIVIDIRGTAQDQWQSAIGLSYLRGMACLTAEVPVWVLQSQGQDSHRWPWLGELPLFTEYQRSQYTWMQRVSQMSTWPVLYEGLGPWAMTEPLMRAFFGHVNPAELPNSGQLGTGDVFAVMPEDFSLPS